jgi:chromosome segregation ATPase
METVQTKPEFDESIYAALVDAETAKKSAAIFGFSSDEALADAHFQINMLASNYDELEDRHEALKREYSLALPLMETVQTAPTSEVDTLIILKNQEIAELKAQLAGKNQIISEADEQISKLEDEAAEYAETKKLYNEALSEEIRGRNSSEAHDLRQQQEISNLKSEIEDWKAKYLKASNAVRELNHGKFHQPTPIAVEFPEPAIILSQLRAKRKKSKADLGDIEFVVEMLEVLKN